MRAFRWKVLFIVGIIGIFLFTSHAKPTKAVVDEATDFSPESNIIPDQVIVKFKPNQTPFDIERAVKERKLQSQSLFGKVITITTDITLRIKGQEAPEVVYHRIEEVSLDAGVVEQRVLFTSNVLGPETPPELQGFFLYKTDGKKNIDETIKEFALLPGVESVEPNRIYTVLDKPNDPRYPEMWNLVKMEAEKAWNVTHGSNDVIVAVLDTGADFNHEDLKDHLIPGYNYVSNTPNAQDDFGHGTHVSGTIGAMTNNNIGVAGINWNVKIMPVKVLSSSGSGSEDMIVNGIKYAADHGAKVINMSLGGTSRGCPQSYQSSINYARGKGVTMVVAAGNSSADASGFSPANCQGVVTVSATGVNNEPAHYSNFGSLITLAAPGGNASGGSSNCTVPLCILSTKLGGGYQALMGTSMASPHVAGVVALMLAKNPSLTPDGIAAILKNPANLDPISGGSTQYGPGVLNAFKAVQAAGGGGGSTPTPIPSGTTTPAQTPTPGGPTPTTGPSVTPSGPTPTTGPTEPPATPTVEPAGCPEACTIEHPDVLPREKGNSNCDDVIDERDYVDWRKQFRLYQEGNTIAKEDRTADFYCKLDTPSSQKVDLIDFEIWRAELYPNPPTAAPTLQSTPPVGGISIAPSPPSTPGERPSPMALRK